MRSKRRLRDHNNKTTGLIILGNQSNSQTLRTHPKREGHWYSWDDLTACFCQIAKFILLARAWPPIPDSSLTWPHGEQGEHTDQARSQAGGQVRCEWGYQGRPSDGTEEQEVKERTDTILGNWSTGFDTQNDVELITDIWRSWNHDNKVNKTLGQ